MNSAWETQTFKYKHIETQARSTKYMGNMLTWLKEIGCIPQGVTWGRTNRTPNTNLNPDAIPARYLAEFAYEWDSWGGGSTPRQFVDALAFEVSGNQKKEATSQILQGLGA